MFLVDDVSEVYEARLIPTSGIKGTDEQERRATSALLAVMTAVKEFGRGLTAPLGAPAGKLQTYVEVPFQVGDSKLYPDGVITVTRGSRSWTALVEVKTGRNTLHTEQLENYLTLARDRGFQAVLTISNEMPAVAGQHPTVVDKKLLRKISLYHLSWSQVLAAAVMQKEYRGVADPDQAWILGELIRYLEHEQSGAMEFTDMGPSWVSIREAVVASTFRPGDKGAGEVVARFDALLTYISLRLGRQIGTDVAPELSRRELADPALRAQSLIDSLASGGTLQGAIKIPNTVAPLTVKVDVRAGRVTCHVDLDAPREGRATTRVNWLVRQLKAAPDNVRVEAFVAHGRGPGTAELLKVVRDKPTIIIADPAKDLRLFRIAASCPMGAKRDRGRGSLIDSVVTAVETFYRDVMQHLKAWSAAPPRLREPAEIEPHIPKALPSTSLSSQDGAEPVPDLDANSTTASAET